MGEINGNAVIEISRPTGGQYDAREEIVVPVGGLSSFHNERMEVDNLKKLAKAVNCFPNCIKCRRVERAQQGDD